LNGYCRPQADVTLDRVTFRTPAIRIRRHRVGAPAPVNPEISTPASPPGSAAPGAADP
jgi:hypothetical protein